MMQFFGWVKTVFMRMRTNSTTSCSVRDKVFLDFNNSQADKVFLVLTQWGEIWWFYPSANSAEIDKYVIYNYLERHGIMDHYLELLGMIEV